VSGTRGNAEGVRGAARVLNTKNAPSVARFSCSAGGAVPNTKNTPHGPVFRVWQVGEGRGGEGRHVGVSGIPSGWGRLEGGAG